MVLHVEEGEVVKVSGDADHPTNFGRLCTKGASAHVALRRSGRLDRAFVRRAREADLCRCRPATRSPTPRAACARCSTHTG